MTLDEARDDNEITLDELIQELKDHDFSDPLDIGECKDHAAMGNGMYNSRLIIEWLGY